MPRTFQLTRIAPTPSGYLHLGNAFSFLLTAALARQTGAGILLRIDDMDRERMRPEYVADIFDTLHYLRIEWQQGPVDPADFEAHWSQLKRMALYEAALQTLVSGHHVFACTCSRTDLQGSNGIYPGTCSKKKLPLDLPGAALRLRTDDRTLSVLIQDGKKIKTTLPAAQSDFIVWKKDGFPAYQLSSLVDDMHFGADLVVRGEDLWDSTLAQLFLADVLEYRRFSDTVFIQHALLLNEDGRKLSKSAGDGSIRQLRQQGLPFEELSSRFEKEMALYLR